MRVPRIRTGVMLLAVAAAIVGGIVAVIVVLSSPDDPPPARPPDRDLAAETSPSGPSANESREEADARAIAERVKGSIAPHPPDQPIRQDLPSARQVDIQTSRVQDNMLGDIVNSKQFRQLLSRDGIAPIYEPRFTAGKLTRLQPGELVMGVEIKGESKAYPVGPLNFREMVNDVVGGVPVLVSW